MCGEKITLSLCDADIRVYPELYTRQQADALLQQVESQVTWRQDQIRVYGKVHQLPRLTAWYGDAGTCYEYSGIKMDPLPWTPVLGVIRDRPEDLSGDQFNSVLLNRYRDGRDSMGWHSDDEQSLGVNPVIGSLSLGATRRFRLQHKVKKHLKQSLDLNHGNYLLMAGTTQHYWRHCITRTQRACAVRINLTFRYLG